MNIFEIYENGKLTVGAETIDLATVPWTKHAEFEGVFVKPVVSGDMTGGQFRCLLVRIEPNHKIGLHSHADSVELHEVVAGSGVCLTEQGDIPYVPGRMGLMALNAPHEIRAGDEGLCIFAKFFAVSK